MDRGMAGYSPWVLEKDGAVAVAEHWYQDGHWASEQEKPLALLQRTVSLGPMARRHPASGQKVSSSLLLKPPQLTASGPFCPLTQKAAGTNPAWRQERVFCLAHGSRPHWPLQVTSHGTVLPSSGPPPALAHKSRCHHPS